MARPVGGEDLPAPTPRRFSDLWRHHEFLKLWVGQTISLFGSQLTLLALPLVAVLTLRASPAEMGFLRAAQTIPALLVGLFAGVWVDRLRRRPLMLWSDLGRALCLAIIPLATLLGLLQIEILYAVGFLVGLLTVLFDVAYMSFVPILVRRDQLLDANSKLETSTSAAAVIGPAAAGVLVQLVTAPLVILLDAGSFLASMFSLALIRTPEVPPALGSRRPIWEEARAGLRVVLSHPFLRTLAFLPALVNLSSGIQVTVLLLYLTRDLHLTPALLGLIFSGTGPGFLVGALLVNRIGERFGPGPALVWAALVFLLRMLAVPLVGGPVALVVVVLTGMNFLNGVAGQVNAIVSVSLRQVTTPDRLLGRTNATIRLIAWSTAPLAGFLGGALGTAIGLRPTLVVAAAVACLAPLSLWVSPLHALATMPDPDDGVMGA